MLDDDVIESDFFDKRQYEPSSSEYPQVIRWSFFGRYCFVIPSDGRGPTLISRALRATSLTRLTVGARRNTD